MLLSQIQIFEYFEWAALLTGLALFKVTRKRPYQILLIYLIITVIVESGNHLGWYYSREHRSNNWIYNLSICAEYMCFSYVIIFSGHFRSPLKLFLILASVFQTVYFINILCFQGFWELNTYTILFLSLLVIVLSFICLFRILLEDNPDPLFKNPKLWICMGFIFFYILEALLYAVFPYLAYTDPEVFFRLFSVITSVGISVLYSTIIISFILLWKFRRN